MFWLFDKKDKFSFIQIFPYYKKYKDSGANCINWLYEFNVDNGEMPNISNIETLEISYNITIKDDYIQYIDNNTNNIITWQIENEFIKENDELNNYKLPFFKWKYVLVDNHKMPFVSIKNYDLYYSNVSFTIYKFNDNKLFVIEKINNNSKTYILEQLKNLN
jgi:hypothetical protein